MSRDRAIAQVVEGLISKASRSIDVAVYRFNHPGLARDVAAALALGVKVRLVLDRNKYEESASTRALFAGAAIPFRLLYGRQGAGTKMHHKFAILDEQTVLTGSYNWTLESEEQNFENLIILRESDQVKTYREEFESLWAAAAPPTE